MRAKLLCSIARAISRRNTAKITYRTQHPGEICDTLIHITVPKFVISLCTLAMLTVDAPVDIVVFMQ